MKLLRLKLLTDFRGLPKDFEIEFSAAARTDKIDPICFVGPNGGGKSNLLELLCEIFYHLDYLHLDYYDSGAAKSPDFGFEIEYRLSQSLHTPKTTQVKVTKTEGGPARFYLLKKDKYEEIEEKEQRKRLLPHKVVGYSSGLNELISNPFIKMQFHYFNEYEKKVKDRIFDRIEDSRLLYMDYEANAAILVANYLLHPENDLSVLAHHLKFTHLITFRIKIHFKNYRSKPITLTPDLKNQIDFLKKCATCIDDKTNTKEKSLILDYFVTEETRKAFQHYFKTPFQLYRVFHLLGLLNIHSITAKQRDALRRAGGEVNISDQLPRPAPEEYIFRIEDIRLRREEVAGPIPYKNISDGEHQFMHVAGMVMMMEEPDILFLLDEPETHFNPQWRSKLVNTLNKVTAGGKNGSAERRSQQEFIITTHSPFILSDCHQNQVFVFERDQDNRVVKRKADIQTYGASTSVLLAEVFDKENTISDMAYADIEKLMAADIKSLEDIDEIRRKARQLGESAEKFLLFSRLSKMKKRLT
jgi:restriction system-associated AAA family ATPase